MGLYKNYIFLLLLIYGQTCRVTCNNVNGHGYQISNMGGPAESDITLTMDMGIKYQIQADLQC